MGPAEVRVGMVECAGNGRCNIRVKGLPLLRVKPNRALPDSEKLGDLRIKREGRKLWACLTYKTEVVDLPETGQALGIEMGVSGRVVTSYGEAIKRIVLIDAGNGVWRDGFRAPSAGPIASKRRVTDYAREKAKAALRAVAFPFSRFMSERPVAAAELAGCGSSAQYSSARSPVSHG